MAGQGAVFGAAVDNNIIATQVLHTTALAQQTPGGAGAAATRRCPQPPHSKRTWNNRNAGFDFFDFDEPVAE